MSSRRHKETESENTKPHQAESHEDGRLRAKSNNNSTSKKYFSRISEIKLFSGIGGLLKSTGTATRYLAEKITQALGAPLGTCTFEIDDKWVKMKIPRSEFNDRDIEMLQQYNAHASPQQEEKTKKDNRGCKAIEYLYNKIVDSKLGQFFRASWGAVKEKGIKVVAFCSSFFIASNKVFSSNDDPYGYRKVSHYYDNVVLPEIELGTIDPITREWLDRNIRWFRNWKPAVTYEDQKAKRGRAKHRLWEKLIEALQSFLIDLAPEYAVAC